MKSHFYKLAVEELRFLGRLRVVLLQLIHIVLYTMEYSVLWTWMSCFYEKMPSQNLNQGSLIVTSIVRNKLFWDWHQIYIISSQKCIWNNHCKMSAIFNRPPFGNGMECYIFLQIVPFSTEKWVTTYTIENCLQYLANIFGTFVILQGWNGLLN